MTKSDSLQKSLESVAKGATIVLIGLVAGKMLGMVNQVILARFMGPVDYGKFNLALSVVTITFSIASFGMFGALPRFIPYNARLNNKGKVKSVIDFSAIFVFSINVLAAAIIFLFSGRIAVGVFKEPQLQNVLRIFALGVPIIALNQVAMGVIRGFKAARYDALLFKIGNRIIKISIFLLFAVTGYALQGAIIAFISGTFITFLISAWLVRKKLFPDYSSCSREPVGKEMLKFAWPLALTGITFLFLSKTDMMLLGYFLSSKEVGIYTPAITIARLMLFISLAFKYIFLPVVSEFFAKGDMEGLSSLYKSVSKWIMLTVLPVMIYCLVFAREILRILYGNEYVAGDIALFILVIGISVNVFQGTSGNMLIGAGHTKLNFLAELLAAAFNVIFNILLIPEYGIIGAAIATSAAYVFRNIFFITSIYKVLKIHPYKASYLYILFSASVPAVLLWGLKAYSTLHWGVEMIAAGLILPSVYMLLILLTRSFDENDIVVLEGIERKFRIRLGFIKKFARP